MLKESSVLLRILLLVVDMVILLVAFWSAHAVVRYLFLPGIPHISRFISLYYLSLPVVIGAFFYFRVYGPFSVLRPMELARRISLAMVAAGIMSAAMLYLIKAGYMSRRLFGVYFVIALFMEVGFRFILLWWWTELLHRGHGVRQVVVVGHGGRLQEVLSYLERHPALGFSIQAVFPLEEGVESGIEEQFRSLAVDEVFLAASRQVCPPTLVGRLLKRVESYGKTIRVFINLDEELRFSHVELFRFGHLPGLVFTSRVLDPDQLILKRVMDLVVAFVGLCMTILMFPMVALAIKLDSPGPVIFAQERVGLNGRRFRLYKFRSMYVDAEERKRELMARNEMEGPIFKLSHDPRITRVGRWLRMFSIDEFPQFWNVLKGDMSIVGTRPPTSDEVKHYQAWHYRRISIKPGITGLWQVSGRNKIKSFDEIVRLDLEYIANWSLWLDMKIIAKTIVLLLLPKQAGAC